MLVKSFAAVILKSRSVNLLRKPTAAMSTGTETKLIPFLTLEIKHNLRYMHEITNAYFE